MIAVKLRTSDIPRLPAAPTRATRASGGTRWAPFAGCRTSSPCIQYPFAEPHNKYYAAKKAWDDAHAEKKAADHHLYICLEKRKKLDKEAVPLESALGRSRQKAAGADTSPTGLERAAAFPTDSAPTFTDLEVTIPSSLAMERCLLSLVPTLASAL